LTTIARGLTTITPTLVNGYSASRSSRNIEHDIIGRPDPDVSLAADSTRAGSLELIFASELAASTAQTALGTPGVWTLSDTDRASIAMKFVRQGDMTIALDDETREVWVLTVGFREVLG